MRFDALQSVMSCEASSLLDFCLPLRLFCFQVVLAVFTSLPSPVPLRVRVHPLVCLSPLQSPSSFQARLLGTEVLRNNLPRVLFPLRDFSGVSLLTGEFSTAHLCSVLSVFRALDGLLLASPC
jgi:hypothetical protein